MKKVKVDLMIAKAMFAKSVNIVFLILRSILLVPILLQYWGKEKYGVWIALYAFFNLILALDLGHGTYIGTEFIKLFQSNFSRAKRLLASAFQIAFVTSVVQFIFLWCLYISGLLEKLINIGTFDIQNVYYCLLILLSYRMLFGISKGLLVKIIPAYGLTDKTFWIKLGELFLEIFAIGIGGVMKFSLVSLCFLFVSLKAIYVLLVIALIWKWCPSIFPWWKGGSFKLGWKNYTHALSLSLNSFLDRFSNDGLNIALSSSLGATILPLFSTIKTLANFSLSFSTIITEPLRPELTRLLVQHNKKGIIASLQINWLFTGSVLYCGFIVVSPIIRPIYEYWTKGELIFNPVLYSCLVASALIYNFGNSYNNVLYSANNTKGLLKISVMKVFLLIVLLIPLVKIGGLEGIGIAIVLTELFTSLWLPIRIVHKEEIAIIADTALTKYIGYNRIAIITLLVCIVSHSLLIVYDFSLCIVLGCFIIIVGLLFLQWKKIDEEIKERIYKLIMKEILKKARDEVKY